MKQEININHGTVTEVLGTVSSLVHTQIKEQGNKQKDQAVSEIQDSFCDLLQTLVSQMEKEQALINHVGNCLEKTMNHLKQTADALQERDIAYAKTKVL